MSEFKDLEEQLSHQPPAAPRPGLRDEVLGNVHRELRAVPLMRFAVAACLLIAAVVAIEVEEVGHRLRVEAILSAGANPRIERVIEELSPWLASTQLEDRLRLRTRRKSDQRWAQYVTARFMAGEQDG